MKRLLVALTAVAAFSGTAIAADLPTRTYTKAPPPVMAPSWTGFYIFGGGGGGLWAADTTTQSTATGACTLCINQRQGGSGWFGTVGAGYDWQVNPAWVVGVFADGQFGEISGSIQDQNPFFVGTEKMRDAWAAGARVGYLVAPNVLSYVNGGYSGSNWSGTTFAFTRPGGNTRAHTNGFDRNGWFVGGGVENNLSIFGVSAPGWFMKTEYRAAYYDRKNITELVDGSNAPRGADITFKPWVQTISTSLVYRFNSSGEMAATVPARAYAKAQSPMMAPSWTGLYIFGGGGGGLWAADTGTQSTATGACVLCVNQRQGGSGWFGTVGAGYDWQVNPTWVAGVFADGQFGSISGSIQDQGLLSVGTEKMQDAWAAGLRVGYLVAPNVLSYVNGGYSGSHWSGTSQVFTGALPFNVPGTPEGLHTNGFDRNGWFVGGGVENNLSIFGVTAPGWFMKTEYRTAYYDRKNITELFDGTNAQVGKDITFKPWVQTISTSLVYRFH